MSWAHCIGVTKGADPHASICFHSYANWGCVRPYPWNRNLTVCQNERIRINPNFLEKFSLIYLLSGFSKSKNKTTHTRKYNPALLKTNIINENKRVIIQENMEWKEALTIIPSSWILSQKSQASEIMDSLNWVYVYFTWSWNTRENYQVFKP